MDRAYASRIFRKFQALEKRMNKNLMALYCSSCARLVALVAGAVSGVAALAGGVVTAYPVPQGMEASPDYLVSAGGQSIFVYRTPVCSLATFAVTGEVEVEIKVQRPITHPVIRPLARGIKPVVERGSLRFRLPGPGQLAIEVDDDLHRPLFLFANAPEPKAPKAGAAQVRYFEGGKIHEAGRIELKDNETVYLAGGAVVRGSIHAKHASGLRIAGPGMLDGSTRTTQARLVELDTCRNVEVSDVILQGSYGWTLVPRCSENILIHNIKVVGWRDNDDGCDPDSSRHVTVANSFFRTKDDCIAVKAHDYSGKSGASKSDPGKFNTDDVCVTNSIFWSSEWGHALTVGFAVGAPSIRHVVFTDCDIIKKEKGPALSIDNHDLGAVEDVRFEDIRVEEGCDKLLALKVAFSQYSADCPSEFFRNNPARKEAQGDAWQQVLREKRSGTRGTIRNVLFKNIRIGGDRLPGSDIVGFSARHEVSEVVFKNLSFQGKTLSSPEEAQLRVKNATAIQFEK